MEHRANTDCIRVPSAFHPCQMSDFRVIRIFCGFPAFSFPNLSFPVPVIHPFPTNCQIPKKNNGQKMYSYSRSTTVLLPPYSNPTGVLLPSCLHSGLQNPKKTAEFREFQNAKKKFRATLKSPSRKPHRSKPSAPCSLPCPMTSQPIMMETSNSNPIEFMPGPKRRPFTAKKSPHSAKRPDQPGDRQKGRTGYWHGRRRRDGARRGQASPAGQVPSRRQRHKGNRVGNGDRPLFAETKIGTVP